MKSISRSRRFAILSALTILECAYAEQVFTPCDLPDSLNAQLNRVEWCCDKFVAVGAEGTVLLSDDGVRWRTRNIPVNGDLLGVTGSGCLHILVAGKAGTHGLLFLIDLSDSTAEWRDLTDTYYMGKATGLLNITSASNPPYPEFHVAVGTGGTVQSSVDPYLQSPIPETKIPTDQDLYGVATSDDGSFFVAAGEGGIIITGSPEGWMDNPISLLSWPRDMNALFYSVKRIENSYYLCNLNGGKAGLIILNDSLHFAAVTMPDSLGIADITETPTGFYAVSHDLRGLILHSPDALNWRVIDTLSTHTPLRGIASKPGTDTIVVVGNNGAVFSATRSSVANAKGRVTPSMEVGTVKPTKGFSATVPSVLIGRKYDMRGRCVPRGTSPKHPLRSPSLARQW